MNRKKRKLARAFGPAIIDMGDAWSSSAVRHKPSAIKLMTCQRFDPIRCSGRFASLCRTGIGARHSHIACGRRALKGLPIPASSRRQARTSGKASIKAYGPGAPPSYRENGMSIFTEEEIAESHLLTDAAQIESGEIRGDLDSCMIAGNVLCGKHTTINGYLNARGNIRIGKYCALGRFISIHAAKRRIDTPNQQVQFCRRFGFSLPHERQRVEIGHNVWIGDKVSILAGVTVGHGAVLAAGSTVVSNVPPFGIVEGVPAQLVRKRFSDHVIEQMLDICWWDWDDDKIRANRLFFESALEPDPDYDLYPAIV